MRTLIARRLDSSNTGNQFFFTVADDDAASLGICAKPVSDCSYPTADDLVTYANNFGVTLEVEKLVKEGVCVMRITDEAASRMGF